MKNGNLSDLHGESGNLSEQIYIPSDKYGEDGNLSHQNTEDGNISDQINIPSDLHNEDGNLSYQIYILCNLRGKDGHLSDVRGK